MEYTHKERVLPPLNSQVTPSIVINLASVSNNLNGAKAAPIYSKDTKAGKENTLKTSVYSTLSENGVDALDRNSDQVTDFSPVNQHHCVSKHCFLEPIHITDSEQEKIEGKRKIEDSTPDTSTKKTFLNSNIENLNLKSDRNDENVYHSLLPKKSVNTESTNGCSDMDQLPLPAGFGEVELEAIRILGSFSQPRDSKGLAVLEGGSSVSSSRATSVEYTPPQPPQPQQQLQQHLQPHASSPMLGPRLMYDTSNQSSPMSSRANSPSAPSQRAVRRSRGSRRMKHHSEPVSPASSGVDELRSDEEGKSPGMFRCEHPHCGKTFGRLYNLKSHTRTHTDDRPFKCDQCEQAFSRNHDLKRHQKIHTGIKPFECAACGKKFSRMDALGRHRAKKPECLEKV